MATEYTAVIKQEGDWWIGWIEEVPGVNCQERTRQDKAVNLSEKVPDIRGGEIPAKTNVPLYPDIPKSVIALPERYAKISE